MTGVAAHVPGLIRLTDPPLPAGRVTLGNDFAGMLDPIAPSRAEQQVSSATAFDARGMLSSTRPTGMTHEAPQTRESGAAPAAAGEEQVPASLPRTEDDPSMEEAAARPVKMVRALLHDAPPSAAGEWVTSSSIGSLAVSLLPASGVKPPSNQPSHVDEIGGANMPTPRQTPSHPVAAVSVSILMDAGRASVVARGDVSLAELEVRLKRTLSQHDLELTSLRLNGIDQSFTTGRPVGGKYGNR